MKLLILLSIIFSHGYMCSFTPANASTCKNWISQSEFQKSQEGEPAKPNCKKDEKCFCYDGVDLRDAEIRMVTEDILDQPIYETVNPKTMQRTTIGDQGEPITFDTLVCPDGFILKEKQCQKVTGYEQSSPVEKLVISQTKRDARLALEIQERASLEAKKQEQEKFKEILETLADEMGRDDQGRFLNRQEIRQRVKDLKNAGKQ